MARRAELIAEALKALVQTALPNADVARNAKQGDSIGAGGSANLLDGDPGEPEVTLSPLTYTYSHTFELNLAAYESGTKTREEVLSDMLEPIGAAIEADRTLGGLCEWVEPVAPSLDDLDVYGAEPARWAPVPIICVYSTTNPLA